MFICFTTYIQLMSRIKWSMNTTSLLNILHQFQKQIRPNGHRKTSWNNRCFLRKSSIYSAIFNVDILLKLSWPQVDFQILDFKLYFICWFMCKPTYEWRNSCTNCQTFNMLCSHIMACEKQRGNITLHTFICCIKLVFRCQLE